MADDKDPYDTFSGDTLRRAEEMCSGLSLELSIDRRGRCKFYNGAITDLDNPNGRNIRVTVADIEGCPWFTLIADQPLEACRKALLVFRVPPGVDMKYIGNHKDARPGKRGDQDKGRYVLTFNIERDARKESL
jgi:hypothetical protein